jgi:hypothetical protein
MRTTTPYTVSIGSAIMAGLFLFAVYCHNLTDGKCLCPGKQKWPVKYEKQTFCGKELNLWHSSNCDPNMLYDCTRDQVEAKAAFHCKNAFRHFCAPLVPEACDHADSRSAYDNCMVGRSCIPETYVDRFMNLTYGKNPQKSKKYP